MLRTRHTVALALALGATLAAGAARANGRFPRAEMLVERGGDPEKLVLSATYGLLVSADGGGTWRHVCELGFAFGIAEIDPLIGVFADDAMIVKGIRTLNRALAPFCAFEPVLVGVGSDTVVDFSLDRTTPNRVLALMMERGETGLSVNRLYESVDAGQTFGAFGSPLPEDEVSFGTTLDVAPSDASRLYATALGRDGSALFVRSDDAGETWSTSVLDVESEEYPYIAAVAPANADGVYVRTDFWALSDDGILLANDALFHSDDGGASFRELIRMPGKLLGFALSPDGAEVLVGYGDPVDPARTVDESVLGIYRASTADFVFTKIYEGPVSCLAWTENGLYACTSQAERGFALGVAPNADFELDVSDPFTPLLDLTMVEGPVDCPACTSAAACSDSWASTCALFESCDAAVPPPSSGGGDCAGAGGESSAGSAGSAAAGSSGAASGGAGPRDGETADESCGCRAIGRRANAGSLACFFLILAVAVRCRVSRRVASFLRVG